jgi:hypothetical protein
MKRLRRWPAVTVLLLTLCLGVWLFANWIGYIGARFDCADETEQIAKCTAAVHRQIIIQSALATILWAAVTAPLVRTAKKP